MTEQKEPVTAEPPESPVQTTGTDHVTIWGSNAENVLSFYRVCWGASRPASPNDEKNTGGGAKNLVWTPSRKKPT